MGKLILLECRFRICHSYNSSRDNGVFSETMFDNGENLAIFLAILPFLALGATILTVTKN